MHLYVYVLYSMCISIMTCIYKNFIKVSECVCVSGMSEWVSEWVSECTYQLLRAKRAFWSVQCADFLYQAVCRAVNVLNVSTCI